MSGGPLPRLFEGFFSEESLADDGNRLAPRTAMLGDDSVPCRWWHPDMGPFCARCGSGRMDLHDGEWGNVDEALGPGPLRFSRDREGIPWTDAQRSRLGLPVAEQWWHQSAGMTP